MLRALLRCTGMAWTKAHILAEIKRTARANDGKPLGHVRFGQETGIKMYDWHGRYWPRWGDALEEAGFAKNTMVSAYSDEQRFGSLVGLIRTLGHWPVTGEFRMKRREDPTFAGHSAFGRWGKKQQLIGRVLEYCATHPGNDDVAQICEVARIAAASIDESPAEELASAEEGQPEAGFVYLLKSGRHYKIGRANVFGRRERELAIQLPERAETVHVIKTDDAAGIEAYWHNRFRDRRANGEWFVLGAADVKPFRLRKFM